MQPKHPLLQQCLHRLQSLPNLKVKIEVEPYLSHEVLADAQLTLYSSHYSISYICEIKSNVTSETIESIIAYFKSLQARLDKETKSLLIASELSNIVIDRLLEENIEFVDTKGSLYLNSIAAYILVRYQSSAKKRSDLPKEITSTALKVIYILLQNPDFFVSMPLSKLAKEADISMHSVRNIFQNLIHLNYIKRLRKGYRILDYTELLERWQLGYIERLRSQLLIDTFTPIGNRNFSDVEENIKKYAEEYNYLIGGELGAAIATDYLRPVGATLHIRDNYRPIFVKLKLKPSSQGKIIFLNQFGTSNAWNSKKFLHLADPLLIYAELLTSSDERLKKTANRFFTQYIALRARE